jgi:hypothetical protein
MIGHAVAMFLWATTRVAVATSSSGKARGSAPVRRRNRA